MDAPAAAPTPSLLIKGSPTAHEVAAVVAVLQAVAAAAPAAPTAPPRHWAAPYRLTRELLLPPGPDRWRMSGLPR